MTSVSEKGGGAFTGIKLLLCENPLPPIDKPISDAQAEALRSNYYTQPYSEPLRTLLSEQIGVPERLININAGSELILRQLFERFGQQVHLLAPTYALFPEIARCFTETRLLPEQEFGFELARLDVPPGTTLRDDDPRYVFKHLPRALHRPHLDELWADVTLARRIGSPHGVLVVPGDADLVFLFGFLCSDGLNAKEDEEGREGKL